MAGCREPAGQERKPQVENYSDSGGRTAVRQRRVQRGQPLACDRMQQQIDTLRMQTRDRVRFTIRDKYER